MSSLDHATNESSDRQAGGAEWYAAWALCHRELVRFFRQRNRVIGAVGQPVMFWLLFGIGLDQSFRIPQSGAGTGQSFQEYYVPGTLALIVLFTAIFATISIIEDRKEGFLQSVLVAPLPRWSMVGGKILGASILALGQAVLFLAFAPAAGIPVGATAAVQAVIVLALVALALTGLGFAIAWHMDSTQGFHAIMTAFLMPMWFLSGAFFPPTGAPAWLQWIIALNPLTYGLAALRRVLYVDDPAVVAALPQMDVSLLISILFAVTMVAAAWASVVRSGQR